jgi:glycosyltransferase involved in cell wall biosynthesis
VAPDSLKNPRVSVWERWRQTRVTDEVPRVSVGLAVFNGEPYLEEAIRSILSQTFEDFELILSDNASTDGTAAICRRFAAEDPRIRYYRNATNIGGANNENRTFALSRGPYFRWAAHDDVCAPELLERCVAILDRDPDVVVCFTQVVEIDHNGTRGRVNSRNNASSARPHERFAGIASSKDFCEETYGLIRSEVLRKTRLQQNYTGSDRTLLCELALYGRFYEVPEPLFFKRFHPKNVYTDWRARMAWFDSSLEGRISFPFWAQLLDYFETIRRAEVPASVKRRCRLYMARWVVEHARNLAKDVLVAGYMLLHTPEWRRRRHRKENIWS